MISGVDFCFVSQFEKVKTMVRFVVMLCLICVANTGQAEGLLKRIFGAKDTGQYSSSCPNGQCPTANAPSASVMQSTPVASIVQMPFKAVDNVRGHWSYPGTIDNHLESTHGVSTAGMTREQKLSLHDSLHEGTANQVLQSETVVTMVPRANYVEQVQSNYPSRSSVGNGSFGGGSSGGFAVGKMYKGELVTSIGEPQPVPEVASALPSEAKSILAGGVFDKMRARKAFRKVATEAAQRKLDSGEWTKEQFDNFTFAIYVPRIADEMRESLEEKVVADGAFGSTQAVNWENIEKMIELVIKYLPMLLKLFADDSTPVTINAAPYVSLEKSPPSVYELMYGDIAA